MGYNFRIAAIKSLAVVIKYMNKDDITNSVIPVFIKATNDKVPNVQFTVCQILTQNKQFIEKSVFEGQVVPKLKELTRQGADNDVWYHSTMCLHETTH